MGNGNWARLWGQTDPELSTFQSSTFKDTAPVAYGAAPSQLRCIRFAFRYTLHRAATMPPNSASDTGIEERRCCVRQIGLDPHPPIHIAPGRLALDPPALHCCRSDASSANSRTAVVQGERLGQLPGRPTGSNQAHAPCDSPVMGRLAGRRLSAPLGRTLVASPPDLCHCMGLFPTHCLLVPPAKHSFVFCTYRPLRSRLIALSEGSPPPLCQKLAK